MRMKHATHSQCGAAIIETSLVLMPLLVLGALVIELTHSQQVRQLAQLALYEAARAGTTSGTHYGRINQAFREAILPLYAPRGSHQTSADRRDVTEKNIKHATGLSLWEIQVLHPNTSVFKDFADAELSKKYGQATLRNDFLVEQHQENIQKGWVEGRGPLSGRTVFEANTLRLQLSLIYTPLVPGTGFILKILSGSRTDRTGIAWGKGYLVANIWTEVMMQSHAQQWKSIQPKYAGKPQQPLEKLLKPSSTQLTANQIEPKPSPVMQNKSGQTLQVLDAALDSFTHRQIKPVNQASTSDGVRAVEDNLCNGLLCCQ